jgi:phenylpropionate dioxygenase-like ring-hydroxylating dioxygenase large terminal subunit
MDDLHPVLAGPSIGWSDTTNTRVPYAVFTDPGVYAAEHKRLFRGPVWNFLALETEIPAPGDFKTTFVGEIPVIVNRGHDGAVNALVNRCAHRGSLVCHDKKGNKRLFVCAYHNWSYDAAGALKGVAFKDGVKGQGGMDADFDMAAHGLERLRVANFRGMLFGTFSDDTPDIESYLGPDMCAYASRVFNRPVRIIGQYSQLLRCNWKLMMENVRDTYHAAILHLFYNTFGLNRLSMEGGIVMDERGWHHVSYSKIATDDIAGTDYATGKIHNMRSDLALADPSVAAFVPEFADGISTHIQSVFPAFLIQQIQNCIGVRQLVPRGVDRAELFWTLLGYEDDTEEMAAVRRKQSNMVGPAGYVSLEDGAVLDFVQRALREKPDGGTVMVLGGDTIEKETTHRATETSVRAYWRAYREVMGL